MWVCMCGYRWVWVDVGECGREWVSVSVSGCVGG